MGLSRGWPSADARDAARPAATRGRRWSRAVEAADPQERAAGASRTRSTPWSAPTSRCSPSREPERTTTYGDLEHRLHRHARRCPTGTEPTPRERRRRAPARATRCAARCRSTPRASPTLREATERFVALVTTMLDDAGINYLSVTGRAKSVASFAAKADRTVDGVPRLHRPAARDHRPDRGPGDHLRAQRRRRGRRPARRPGGGPRRPRHGPGDRAARAGSATPAGTCWSRSTPARESQPAYEPLRGRRAQVQIRTVLQHAWAEFEHDIRYKGTIPEEHVPDFDRRFTLAAGLLELADREFSTIRDRLQAGAARASRPSPTTTTRGSARGSSRRSWPGSTPTPAGRAPTTTPGSPGCCSSSASPRSTSSADVLRPVDSAAINARMDYRYPPGAVRRLDDALLAAFGERVRRRCTATPTARRCCGPGWTG